jgi:glycosyltransferase involved in cell wall biosynthesis
MIDFHPKVSIIIPVYNGENYLREAIDSALMQTYDNFEVIVVNDGSTDRTEEIAVEYGAKIKYFKKDNGGQSSALNFGVGKMSGDYFSWLSHDDVYYSNKLEEQIASLRQISNPTEAFIYSNYEIIDQHSQHIAFVENKKIPSSEFVWRMLVNVPVNGCTVLIHKTLLDKVGGFNIMKPHTSDVELFLKLGLFVNPFHLPFILIKSRSHSKQATFRNRKQHLYESNLYGIDALKMIPEEILLKSSALNTMSEVYKHLGILWARKGYIAASNEALKYYNSCSKKSFHYIYLKVICTGKYLFRIFRRRIVRIIRAFAK